MVLYLYVLAAVVFRLIPHPWDVTPLAAMFLFSGATFKSKSRSLLVPFIALLVSDGAVDLFLYHGHYGWFSPFTWAGFLMIGLLGWMLRGKFRWYGVAGASVAGSTIFFLVADFGVWLFTPIYPKTGAGLTTCYIAALPFYGNALAGDLFFAALMFGSYYWLLHRKAAQVEAVSS
jgi:hypothetical protein